MGCAILPIYIQKLRDRKIDYTLSFILLHKMYQSELAYFVYEYNNIVTCACYLDM